MTEQDPWATPQSGAASQGSMRPVAPLNAVPSPPPPPVGYAQLPPSPPVGYAQAPPPYYGAPAGAQKNWMGITALVLSLATMVTWFTWIGGIIFGHMGLAAVKRGEASNRGIALAGTIVGWVFGGITILGIFFFIVIMATANTSYD